MQLSQKQYCIDLLKRFNMADCKPVTTPMEPGLRLTHDMCPTTAKDIAEMKDVPYLNAVGALNYLAVATRPDISYAVHKLARFNANPGADHWKAVKHLFRYVQGTKDLSLTYAPDPNQESLFTTYSDGVHEKHQFTVYTDADFAGDKDNKKSTNGFVIKIGTGAVSWTSKLQGKLARSSTEAEFYGAGLAGTEIIWLRQLLGELGRKFPGPSPLHVDNQSTIQVLNDSVQNSRMKHITLDEFWIRDQVAEKKTISIHYCPTNVMPADLLTKALPRIAVEGHRQRMGLY